METYWIMICVELHGEISPDPNDDEDIMPSIGYFRNFGVMASSEEEAWEIVAASVADGEISRSESTISSVAIRLLDPEIIERSGNWGMEGIWYQSGRIFFPAA